MKAFLPWAVEEAFRIKTGRPLQARFSRQGDSLHITAATTGEADLMMEVNQIAGTHITAAIWAPELDTHEADEILPGFATQGVTAVFRPPERLY